MKPDDVGRTCRCGGDRVEVKGRGVGREQGTGFEHSVELAEHRAFDLQVFIDRLDDEIAPGQPVVRVRCL